jgi:uncharacterized protein (TIGR02246 family)
VNRSFKMHIATIVFAPVLLCGAVAPASAAVPDALAAIRVPDEVPQGMLDLLRKADDAYDRRDAATMASFYAPDGSTTVSGQHFKGKADILAFFTGMYKTLPAGLTHRTVLRRAERIGDLYATDNDVFLEVPDGAGGKRVVRQFFTFTMVRPGPDGWEIVAVRATPLAAPPAR